MNQALEDAVELAQAIKEGGLNPDSLRAYESKRIPRIQEIMAAEMVSHTAFAYVSQHMSKLYADFRLLLDAYFT